MYNDIRNELDQAIADEARAYNVPGRTLEYRNIVKVFADDVFIGLCPRSIVSRVLLGMEDRHEAVVFTHSRVTELAAA